MRRLEADFFVRKIALALETAARRPRFEVFAQPYKWYESFEWLSLLIGRSAGVRTLALGIVRRGFARGGDIFRRGIL